MSLLSHIFSHFFRRESAATPDIPLFPAPVDTTPAEADRDVLMIAAQNQPASFIQTLIDGGADIHAVDDNGKNAATLALEAGNWGGVIPLLKAGCLVDHNSKAMEWGLRVATYEGDDEFMNAVVANKTLAPQLALERKAAAALQQQQDDAANIAGIKNGMQAGSQAAPRTKTVRFKNVGMP